MSVLINFKICDNAKECGGIEVCPTGALSWNDEENSIKIDNDKCISCGRCERECPIGAIRVAKNDEEYKNIKKKIDEDKRTIKDLFVDRYGATPLSEFFMIDANELDNETNNSGICLVEVYDDNSIQCLLKSIPIKELTKELPNDTTFYKVVSTENLNKKYGIEELPALLLFKDKKFINHIDGYYSIDDKDILLGLITKLL